MSKELYIPELKDIRKNLRKNPTKAEEYLWRYLRRMQLGVKFRRQVSIGYYVVDFYCKSLNLAIELDGGIHEINDVKDRDKFRQEIIESEGVIFLRVSNEDVLNDIEIVLNIIKKYI